MTHGFMKLLEIVSKHLMFQVDGKIRLQMLVLDPLSEPETHEDVERRETAE